MAELSFLQLQDLALLIFYKSAKEGIKLPTESLATFHEYRITGHDNFLVAKAIEGLQDKKLVSRAYSFGSAKITARGLERVERELEKSGSIMEKHCRISTLKVFAEPTSEQVAKSSHVNVVNVALLDFIPASDRIVTLEHNSEQRREIVDAVDAVVEAVKGDNEYGDNKPEEKEAIVTALAAGRKLLDSVQIRVAAIKASLLPVLKFVAETFAKETVKGLAAKAIAFILKWIGLG